MLGINIIIPYREKDMVSTFCINVDNIYNYRYLHSNSDFHSKLSTTLSIMQTNKRINDQYRICFYADESGFKEVEIIDCHD